MVLAHFSCWYHASRYRARARQKDAFWRGVLARARAVPRHNNNNNNNNNNKKSKNQQHQQQQRQQREQQQQQQEI